LKVAQCGSLEFFEELVPSTWGREFTVVIATNLEIKKRADDVNVWREDP
jgi:hypothetical protein